MQVQKVIKHTKQKRNRHIETDQASNLKQVSAKYFVYDLALTLH